MPSPSKLEGELHEEDQPLSSSYEPSMEEISDYEEDKGDDEGILDGWEQQVPVMQVEEVEEILATRIGRKTRNKEYLEYLVKWKNKGSEDASWVFEEELICL